MRDRGTEWACRCALRVEVDPLMVAGRIGERVDLVLGDRVPAAGTQVLARGGDELISGGEGAHHRAPPFTYSVWPDTYAASSLAKNAITEAISSGCATRRSGVLSAAMRWRSSGVLPTRRAVASVIGVAT